MLPSWAARKQVSTQPGVGGRWGCGCEPKRAPRWHARQHWALTPKLPGLLRGEKAEHPALKTSPANFEPNLKDTQGRKPAKLASLTGRLPPRRTATSKPAENQLGPFILPQGRGGVALTLVLARDGFWDPHLLVQSPLAGKP